MIDHGIEIILKIKNGMIVSLTVPIIIEIDRMMMIMKLNVKTAIQNQIIILDFQKNIKIRRVLEVLHHLKRKLV